ncbi:unnamed protein product [Discosporangium mesarthrocarpum]
MAFFGLTALGPQNSFSVALQGSCSIGIFSDKDLEKAFSAVDKDTRGYIEGVELKNFLVALYHGEPPKGDTECFMERFDEKKDGRISLEEIIRKVASIQKEVQDKFEESKHNRGSGSEFSSNFEYREHVRRQHFTARGPRQRYSSPLTEQQELGWEPQLPLKWEAIRGKKSCPETVYASELVKSGVYF